MSSTPKPPWTDIGGVPRGFPFNLFGGAPPASPGGAHPLAQGLASGVDWMKTFLGQMPGGSAIPGFLLPTVDVEELDKRVSDLRAAESWLEVNLNMLRATIQGLEVQRNTIAAIQSFGAMGSTSGPTAAMPSSSAASPPNAMGMPSSGLPPGWPSPSASPLRAPMSAAAPTATGAANEDDADADAPMHEAEAAEAPEPAPASSPSRSKTSKRKPAASPSVDETPTKAGPTAGLASVAANQWLDYMQQQFAKVAQAALNSAPSSVSSPSASANDSSDGRTASGAKRTSKKKATANKRRSPR